LLFWITASGYCHQHAKEPAAESALHIKVTDLIAELARLMTESRCKKTLAASGRAGNQHGVE